MNSSLQILEARYICVFSLYFSVISRCLLIAVYPSAPRKVIGLILAIHRDPGKDFQITELTKVCSRHFKQTDLKKSLNGKKVSLKEGIVPSKFPWTDSPRKRKAPAIHIPLPPKAKAAKHDGEEVDIDEPSTSTSKSLQDELQELEEQNSNLQEKIKELEQELNEVKAEKERLESKNSELTSQLETEACIPRRYFLQDQAEAESERKLDEIADINART